MEKLRIVLSGSNVRNYKQSKINLKDENSAANHKKNHADETLAKPVVSNRQETR